MRLVLFILTFLGFVTLEAFAISNNTSEGIPFYLAFLTGVFFFGAVYFVAWNYCGNPPALPFAPSPFADRGHNVYAVADEFARAVVGRSLEKAGYRLQGTFKAGPTDQRLYGADLVLMLFGPAPKEDPNYDPERLPFIARSLVVTNPEMAALELADGLKHIGCKANIHRPLPDHKDKFFMVTSNAFIGGWGIAFRPWGPKMGKPESWKLGG